MSSLDKTLTNAYYEIEINPKTQLPVSMYMVILCGARGGTEAKGKQITGGSHVSFLFKYEISDFGKVEKPQIPLPAQKLLAKS